MSLAKILIYQRLVDWLNGSPTLKKGEELLRRNSAIWAPTLLFIVPLGVTALAAYRNSLIAQTDLLLLFVPSLVWMCLVPRRLVYFLTVGCCFLPLLTYDLGFMPQLDFLFDVVRMLAFISALCGSRKKINQNYFWSCMIVLLIVGTISALVNGVRIRLYYSAVRALVFPTLFFYSCARLLDFRDVIRIVKIYVIVLVINACLCSYQIFFLHLGADSINGFFSTMVGTNAYMNVFLLGLTAIVAAHFSASQKLRWWHLLVLSLSMYIAAIAEIKMYYIELVLITALTVIGARPTKRTIVFCLIVAVMLIVGYCALVALYPAWRGFFRIESMFNYSSQEAGYSLEGNLNRLNAIPKLQGLFMKNPFDVLFGFGLGSGRTTVNLTSPLYAEYGETLNWDWFSDAMIFLETGYLGLLAYIGAYVSIAVVYYRRWRCHVSAGWPLRLGLLLGPLSVMLIFYNYSLNLPISQTIWLFFLAVPYIYEAQGNKCSDIGTSACSTGAEFRR